MVYVVGYRHSDAYIVPTISKKKEGEREEKQAKNGYWQNELDSLGIEQKEKKELDDKEQLEDLSDNIKQAMFQDNKLKNIFLFLLSWDSSQLSAASHRTR